MKESGIDVSSFAILPLGTARALPDGRGAERAQKKKRSFRK